MPNPYAILSALGVSLALIVGAYFYGCHHTDLKWQAATQEALAKSTADARAKDNINSSLANKVDMANADKQDALDKADDLARKLASTRGLYDKAARGCVSRTTANSGSGKDDTPGSRLSDEASAFLLTLTRAADRAAVYAQSCHAWAMSVGK